MEIFGSLALLLVILLAFNSMASGRASSVLRPAQRVAENLVTFGVKGLVNLVGAIFRLGGSSIKLPEKRTGKDNGPSGPPPPRWDSKGDKSD